MKRFIYALRNCKSKDNKNSPQFKRIKGRKMRRLDFDNSLFCPNEDIVDMKHIKYFENYLEIRQIYLSNNLILEISNLEDLRNLNFLDLQGNIICEIKGLEKSINLKDLYLGGNNISYIYGLDNL